MSLFIFNNTHFNFLKFLKLNTIQLSLFCYEFILPKEKENTKIISCLTPDRSAELWMLLIVERLVYVLLISNLGSPIYISFTLSRVNAFPDAYGGLKPQIVLNLYIDISQNALQYCQLVKELNPTHFVFGSLFFIILLVFGYNLEVM